MADTGFESYEEPAEDAPSRFGRVKTALSTALGALVALSLLLALGVWFYRLGVRDAQNVPIIRAATEPAKIRPADPGGKKAPHQEIESYDVADRSAEPASAAAAIIAPTPPEPDAEDVAMGDLAPKPAALAPEPPAAAASDGAAADGVASDGLASDDAVVDDPVVSAILADLAAADGAVPAVGGTVPAADGAGLTEETPAVAGADGGALDEKVALASPDAVADDGALGTLPVTEISPSPALLDATPYAPAISPLAPKRPSDLIARVRAAGERAEKAVDDLAAQAAGSAVQIQLAADPSRAAIEARWQRVLRANRDLLRGRALAVQSTTRGGTTFYRLRVGPFRNRPEAVAVCQALKARGQDCIVAKNG